MEEGTNFAGTPASAGTKGAFFGGPPQYYLCPPGFAAAGVIGSGLSRLLLRGSSSSPSLLGNLGLVCLPFGFHSMELAAARSKSIPSNTPFAPTITPPALSAFSHAKVITAGSYDTGFVSGNYLSARNFYEYSNEVLSTGVYLRSPKVSSDIPLSGLIQQNFAMCAPGYFLDGLWLSSVPFSASTGSRLRFLQRVTLMRCRHESLNRVYFLSPRAPIGASDREFRSHPERIVQDISCKPGYVAVGMKVLSGWYPAGAGFLCQKKPS